MVVTVQFNVMVLLVTVGVLMVKEISWLKQKSDLTDQTVQEVRCEISYHDVPSHTTTHHTILYHTMLSFR